MKKYNVIWFDDQCNDLPLIKEEASLNGIKLTGFSNAEEGIEELEKNIALYDAAIVDGNFYRKKGQSGDQVSDTAFSDVARTLDKLVNKKKLSWYIFSGEKNFTGVKHRYVEAYDDKKVYDKLNEQDKTALWNQLKLDADLQEDTKIRHEFQKVFDVCTKEYIGEENQKHLMQILKSIKNPNTSFDDELYFTQIRIILESLFRSANKYGLLHDACIPNSKVNLTESSLFLAGSETKHLNVKCSVSHFPKIITDAVQSILFITGAASHTTESDAKKNINLIEYRKAINTPYLLYSLTFQLMDVLIWFKGYIEENSDVQKNKKLWVSLSTAPTGNWMKGSVIKIADNGYGTFKPDNGSATITIIPNMISLHNLSEGDEIEIITKLDKTGNKTLIDKIKL